MDDLRERLDALDAEMRDLKRNLGAARRRARAAGAAALLATAGVLTLGTGPEARAQFGITLTSLHNRLLAVEAKTQDMSRGPDPITGQATVRFSGVNVQVVSGSGDNSPNGTGNLIVGYNRSRVPSSRNDRTGSHNLIVGDFHNYSSFGGLVAGVTNTISNQYASVSGGFANTASGNVASVSGGSFNTASGPTSSVSGGQQNMAGGQDASVSGGFINTASGGQASVGGGFDRSVTGGFDWRAGGLFQDF